MASLKQRYRNMHIWIRLLVLIWIVVTVAGLGLVTFSYYQERDSGINNTYDFSRNIHRATIAALTTMWNSGNTMEEKRDFINQINKIENIRNLKIYPSKAVEEEYPDKIMPEIKITPEERSVLQSGKSQYSRLELDGEEYLYVILPIIGSENYLGKNCMDCHQGKPGDVLGFTSMQISLREVNKRTNTFLQNIFIFAVGLFAILIFFVHRFVKKDVDRPIEGISRYIRKMAAGDFTSEIAVYSRDEIGLLRTDLKMMLQKIKDVIASIHKIANQGTTLADSLSANSDEFSNRTQSLASLAEETSAAIEQLSTSIEHVNETTGRSYTNIKEINTRINKFSEAINTINTSMGGLAQMASDLSRKAQEGEGAISNATSAMARIRESSQKISDITGLINDISEKTNLLSLNAAIEAARAGEAGRGFAVVADEISKLADQTVSSVKGITDLIKASNSEIDGGSAMVANSAAVFRDIIDSVTIIDKDALTVMKSLDEQTKNADSIARNVDSISRLSEDISNSTQEQKLASDEINQSIQKVTEETQGISSGTDSLRRLAKEMVGQSEYLDNTVKLFKIE